MTRILLLTNASHDTATYYLDAWSEKIITAAKQQSDIAIFELSKKEATKENVTKLIEKEKPTLVIFNGHGGENSISGYEFEVLIRTGENEKLLEKKIVHAFACKAGKKLGEKCIEIGSLTYLGYRENLKLIHLNKHKKEDKIADPIATFFLEPAFSVIVALIEGKTTYEGYKISQQKYLDNLKILITSNDTNLNTTVAARVYHDLKYQVCLGSRNACF